MKKIKLYAGTSENVMLQQQSFLRLDCVKMYDCGQSAGKTRINLEYIKT